MARKKRNWYPGETMHIMNRGACHQTIFEDEEDYQYFLTLLLDTRKRYPFVVHAFCLMSNHYHLLLETKVDDIGKIMKRINEH